MRERALPKPVTAEPSPAVTGARGDPNTTRSTVYHLMLHDPR